MSRSYRKTPIVGVTTSPSEKEDKRLANRKFRRKTKQAIINDEDAPNKLTEVSDDWSFAKDGKVYINNINEVKHLLRK